MHSENRPPQLSQDSPSLVKRLAGPSTTKAGLAKDQTEINRIIAEASKGSKFYENEKKKDKDVTERIARILKQRDEAMKGADVLQVEKLVDRLLVELELQRDLSQFIVHIDMDAFFANVELLHQPELQGKPFGVGRGVLTTASYEARKYGVRSGMPGFIAKKLCPDLILVPINFPRYVENSEKVMNVFKRYDPNLFAAGCDEAYLNITTYCEEHKIGPEECVQEMRAKVKEETNLTASAGIAPNTMLAKICSDKNKPNGQFCLQFDRKTIVAFMHDLPIRKIQGIGRVNERLLDAIGIKTCGDIFTHRVTLSLMDKYFGLHFLLKTYLGIASNVVQPGRREERKSVGVERTFNALSNKEKILQKLEDIALELEHDLEETGFTGRTVTLKYKLDTYQVFTRAKSFDRCISTKKEDLFATGKELLLPELPLTIRLIGLRVTKLKDLRAPSPAGGIKRFFESVDPSPHKKQKLQHETGALVDDPDAEQDQGGHADAMPRFYEDENDSEMLMYAEAINDTECEEQDRHETTQGKGVDPETRPRPPVSAPARPSSDNTETGYGSSAATVRVKPHSTSHIIRPSDAHIPSVGPKAMPDIRPEAKPSGSGMLQCPICGRTLETDNQGLNSHIDFCLSRGAIMEAQAKATSPIKGFKTWEKKSTKKDRREER